MATERKNPLIGAFRAPAPDASPPAPGPEKPTEPPKATPDLKTAGATAPVKPDEDKPPPRVAQEGHHSQGHRGCCPTKPGEGKKDIYISTSLITT